MCIISVVVYFRKLGSVTALARALDGFPWSQSDVAGGRLKALGKLLMALRSSFTLHGLTLSPPPKIIHSNLVHSKY